MPRPRKDDPHSAAPAKIEAAFWRLLEETGYPEITVRRISQASGTNRNSFYYHYDSLEDLARKAFLDNALEARPLISSLVASLQDNASEDVRPSMDVLAHAERVMLCARTESPFLRNMVNELLRDTWFSELGIDDSRLSEDDRTQVEFIFAGLVAALGSNTASESPLVMARLAASQIGQASLATLRSIAARQKT